MKRIKTVNGYAIYQAITQRDADNYSCQIGSYNLYLSSDIRDYGLNSIPRIGDAFSEDGPYKFEFWDEDEEEEDY